MNRAVIHLNVADFTVSVERLESEIAGGPAVAGTVKADRLDRYVGRTVRVAGWLITGKKVRTRHGDPMEFLSFEDETGIIETVFSPGACERFRRILKVERPYILSGKVMPEWGAVTLAAEHARLLRNPGRS